MRSRSVHMAPPPLARGPARSRTRGKYLRGCSDLADAVEHEPRHGQLHHRFARRAEPLVVLRQPPVTLQPCERPLHDPPLLQDREPPMPRLPLYDPPQPSEDAPDQARRCASVALIGEDHLQAWHAPLHPVEDARGVLAVVASGLVDEHSEHEAERVGDDVALAALDELPPVEAALTA